MTTNTANANAFYASAQAAGVKTNISDAASFASYIAAEIIVFAEGTKIYAAFATARANATDVTTFGDGAGEAPMLQKQPLPTLLLSLSI